MMYALHSNHVFNNNEIITDFEEALQAQEERKKGSRISPTIKCPVEGLYYFDVASYSSQVQRYYSLFGRDKVKVILFDDFSTNTEMVFREVLRFLGVNENVRTEFKVLNASKTTRTSWLKRFTIDPPQWIKTTGQFLFPHQTRRRDFLMYWLWRINTKKIKRKELDADLRKRLIEQFRPEIESLQTVLDRDLSQWLL
jgi:hypothetical protein